MKKTSRTILIVVGVLAVLIGICVLLSMRDVDDFHNKYEGSDLSVDVEGMERTGTYTLYLNGHADADKPSESIDIDLYNNQSEGDVHEEDSPEGDVEKALYTETGSKVTWKVNVPKAGLYNLYVNYFLPESRGVPAERSVLINGEAPFEDARNITFTRIWTDGGDVKVDNQGNEIRPTQTEVFDWQSAYFRDDMGFITEPYQFYFEQGENELTLEAVNEPMLISKLQVKAIEQPKTYAEYSAEVGGKDGSDTAKTFIQTVQGEDSTLRSESSLYAKYDRSSPTTVPNSVTHTVLNYVGGDSWRSSGQWIEWDVEVPEDGLYNLMIKGRQNYSRGSVSSRRVLIDGEVPFDELNEVSFPFENDWNSLTLADENGTPYNIFLTKGTHTVRLEATLGGLGEILEELEDSTYRLNQIYRRVLVYTGANPDIYRDYHIEKTYPEIMEAMDLESKRLYKIVDDMVAFSGQKADQIASAQTVAQQLERFCKKPQKITTEFTAFKDNITALGTASLNMSDTKLDIDYLVVSGTGVQPKKDKANFLSKSGHEIKSFVASFFVDYNSVGDVYDANGSDKVVKVWILTGRDQGTILKSMVDDTFTPESGVKVNVEIVAPDALLNAVLAGRGPNVVLSVGADQPVNYALRGAAEDITQFEGWEDVLAHYSESSYEQYRLDGHVYGIPETQTFNVMFYRKDVLEELGLEPPQTWQELIEMMPTIQGSNLSVGIPTAAGNSGSATASTAIMSSTPDLSMYFSLLYQYGGDMYNDNGTKTTVNTEAGVKAFDDYVRYFNDYGLPVIYDFVSRFRSGEMPIGVAPYSTYNTLMVSAPEIRGLWDFTLIPGTEKSDGSIDRSDFITGSATMMIKEEDEELRKNSWEFMKWWAEPDTQIRFGREIEALLGSSARYATANRDAFKNLSWSAEDIEVLDDQWDQTVGIREVPGGYFTGRHISNAIRKVINEKVDSRETIIDYSILIDEEIVKKRKEFGMPVEE
ncbi:ABC-type glycerol-3-phosphate transport system, substrate-binding protein [Butyrivibrio sp. ob235]|uniref:extracellular solute-binding protein n=1 Tax=Butyrivibrio sp. ob235 TaxID=1761780 RepID=UPI0008D13195|nr:extracellular solute-binding protein [Butyrivibrio sp. ob235]SEL25219.1 ABC-type glycerol-3-phosphate transport system, substrate-binding protein [Butyrivibrio sp. ob235]